MNEPKLKLPLCWVFSSSLSLFFSSRSPFVVAAARNGVEREWVLLYSSNARHANFYLNVGK